MARIDITLDNELYRQFWDNKPRHMKKSEYARNLIAKSLGLIKNAVFGIESHDLGVGV